MTSEQVHKLARGALLRCLGAVDRQDEADVYQSAALAALEGERSLDRELLATFQDPAAGERQYLRQHARGGALAYLRWRAKHAVRNRETEARATSIQPPVDALLDLTKAAEELTPLQQAALQHRLLGGPMPPELESMTRNARDQLWWRTRRALPAEVVR